MFVPEIVKLTFVDTGSYNDIHARPYSTNIDGHICNQFNELVKSNRKGMQLNPAQLAGFAGNILRPQAEASRMPVYIDNGWDIRRMRFMMEVVVRRSNNTEQREVLSGYTDHQGVSHSGFMDPQMKLYFNSSVVLREAQHVTAFGRTSNWAVSNAAHVMARTQNETSGAPSDQLRHLMRPEDVINTMALTGMGLSSDTTTYDTRNTLVAGAKKSSRSNCLAPEYVAKVISSLDVAHNNPEMFNASPEDIYDSAVSGVRDPLFSDDMFLAYLSSQTTFGFTGYVTYQDLCSLFANADHIAQVWKTGETQKMLLPERGSTAYWHETTQEAIIATSLSHAVPAIMTELMVTVIEFSATNKTFSGQFEVHIDGVESFSRGMNLAPYVQQFIHRLKTEVLADLSRNNQIEIDIHMRCDAIGDTFVKVSYMGQPFVDFVTPSFCDALFAPVLAQGPRATHDIALSLNTLYNNTSTELGYGQLVDQFGQPIPQQQNQQPHFQPQATPVNNQQQNSFFPGGFNDSTNGAV